MFSWLSSWWSTENLSGPARNAPNDGVNIKVIIENRPKTVLFLTADEVKARLASLKKTPKKEATPIYKAPLIQEIEGVLAEGSDVFFQSMKNKKINIISAEAANNKSKIGASGFKEAEKVEEVEEVEEVEKVEKIEKVEEICNAQKQELPEVVVTGC